MITNYLLQLKTPKSGTITMMLDYNQHNELVKVELREFNDPTTKEQRDWLWWNFIPKDITELETIKSRKDVKVTELKSDLSFEAFWELYDHKLGNKSRSKKHWDNLNDVTKAIAMQKVREYNFYMAHKTHDKVFAERWLAQKRWENEYKTAR